MPIKSLFVFCASFLLLAASPPAGIVHSQDGPRPALTKTNNSAQVVQSPPAPPNPSPTPCEAICYTYRQEVRQERAQKQGEGYRYFSPLAIKGDEEILRVHIVDRHPFPPIDDDLWIIYNGREVWRMTYPNRVKGDGVIHSSELTKGANMLELWYQNSQGPDANFSFSLAGLAFCSSVAVCHDYDEGITYGTGLLQKTVNQQGFGLFGKGQIVPQAKVWRSTVDDPPASCGCKDP